MTIRTPLGEDYELVFEKREEEFDTAFCMDLMREFSRTIVNRSKSDDEHGFIIRPAETLEALLRCTLNIMNILPSLKDPEARRDFAAAVYQDMMTGVAKPPTQS